jgi:ribosomal protein L7/L12
MKIKFVLLFFFMGMAGSFAQNMESLKARAEKMYAATYAMDLKTVLDLTYPKVFEIMDRETLETAMGSVYENEDMSISFTKEKVKFTYSDIKQVDGKKFNVIKYRSGMKMSLKEALDDEYIDLMAHGLKESGQYDTVTYDKPTNSFLIEEDSILLAVADSSTKNEWTFVNYDDDQLFKMIFDEKTKTALGL